MATAFQIITTFLPERTRRTFRNKKIKKNESNKVCVKNDSNNLNSVEMKLKNNENDFQNFLDLKIANR